MNCNNHTILFLFLHFIQTSFFFLFLQREYRQNMKMPNIEAINPPIVPAANGNQKASFP